MKKLLTLIFVFSLISMNIAYAMDIHLDAASGQDIQIQKNIDVAPGDTDTSDEDVQCQMHCGHCGGHSLITYSSLGAPEFHLASGKFTLPEFRLPYSLNHHPPFQPPIA